MSNQHDCYRRPNRQTLTILAGLPLEGESKSARKIAVAAMLDIHAAKAGKLDKMRQPLQLVDAAFQMAGSDEAIEFH